MKSVLSLLLGIVMVVAITAMGSSPRVLSDEESLSKVGAVVNGGACNGQENPNPKCGSGCTSGKPSGEVQRCKDGTGGTCTDGTEVMCTKKAGATCIEDGWKDQTCTAGC